MRSSIGIDVDAPPELVYRLVRDTAAWASWLPHYTRSRPLRREGSGELVCEFVARRAFVPLLGLEMPVAWRSRTWHEPATRRLRFVHVAGATKGMDVTWTIEPRTGAGTTRVEIVHDFRPPIPVFATFVDLAFTRPIAGRTLRAVKAVAEAMAPGAPDPDSRAAG